MRSRTGHAVSLRGPGLFIVGVAIAMLVLDTPPAEGDEDADERAEIASVEHQIADANRDIAVLRERVDHMHDDSVDQHRLLLEVQSTISELQKILRTVGVVISTAIRVNGHGNGEHDEHDDSGGGEAADTS